MTNFRAHWGPHSRSRSGQTFLLVVVFVAIFLAAVLGLSTDFAQVWAHRQMAQAAADAACQAGAADLYVSTVDTTGSISGLGYIGTDYDCSTNTSSAPCQYASFNGYSGSNVAVSFPSSVSGAPSLSGYTITHPYVKVVVSDPVALTFSKILLSSNSINMSAQATCGLVEVSAHIPLLVLQPSFDAALSRSGGGSITIYGGPQRSIQVNSSTASAVSPTSGGSGAIDLSQAGPNTPATGGDFGVFGNEAQPGYVSVGTTGKWIPKALPWSDPFAGVSAPSKPSTKGGESPVAFGTNGCPDPNGCAEFSAGDFSSSCLTGTVTYQYVNSPPNGCLAVPITISMNDRLKNNPYGTSGEVILPTKNNPGGYAFKVTTTGTSANITNNSFPASGTWNQTVGGTQTDGTVQWTNMGKLPTGSIKTGIFDPGLYYAGAEGFQLNSGSTVRQSIVSGDGSYGTTFYFTGTAAGSNPATVRVDSNSGTSTGCTTSNFPNCIVSYKPDASSQTFSGTSIASTAMNCIGSTTGLPSQVPATIDGNVLMGPCTGAYRGGKATDDASGGTDRGFLFFQDRSKAAQATWGGGGQFVLTGFMYFHNSTYSSCVSTGNKYSLTMGGNSGGTALTLGDIVTDCFSIAGTPNLKMVLNPNVSFPVLAPQLLQ